MSSFCRTIGVTLFTLIIFRHVFSSYKAAGANATDERGTLDTVEFINISKDDALAYPHRVVHRAYPSTVNARMENTIKPFVEKSLEVNNVILGVFERKLGLERGTLVEKHAKERLSGSEARCIKSPAAPTYTAERGDKENRVAVGAHTDFGSLSFLHNWLGGLQVLLPGPGPSEWQYIRPLPGHAICNVGDTLTLFSGGILRSALHRVVPPPGPQAAHARWSLVFFTRPASDEPLRVLADESELVRERVKRMDEEERKRYEPGVTASEWFARRIRNQRIKNRTVSSTCFSFLPI